MAIHLQHSPICGAMWEMARAIHHWISSLPRRNWFIVGPFGLAICPYRSYSRLSDSSSGDASTLYMASRCWKRLTFVKSPTLKAGLAEAPPLAGAWAEAASS